MKFIELSLNILECIFVGIVKLCCVHFTYYSLSDYNCIPFYSQFNA